MKNRDDDSYRAGLWPMPPATRTAQGQPRRMGVELEFSGLDIEAIAGAVLSELGGEAEVISAYEQKLHNTAFGTFGLELDYTYLKQLGRERNLAEESELEQFGESLLKLVAEQVVPHEVVSPPIPMQQLWRLGALLQRLRQAGAKGTRHAAVYAFGLHFNPELPDLGAPTILAYLRSFLCLYEWLVEREQVDLSRRITPYIAPFPRKYVHKVLDADYAPDLATLIDDYLAHNPTRNRALDMLPLFTHLDAARVKKAVADKRVGSRPTLHYRLPNCQIDEGNWSLASPWRNWLQVETLACDERRLARMCRAYRQHFDAPAGGLFHDWPEAMSRWLLPELL
ncbi:amidoligase family protein [Parahaliea mediterranea]|uniref:amidoligase family protein n=1 Tax=Parahaliea mediterranea TaxID=651086 RepID=UPI0019D4BB97|nr:amidoligase family protein [Parahaliea mediterranea]